MLTDVNRQPEILKSILSRATSFRNAGDKLQGGKLLVASCGDGIFAASAAAAYARNLGLDWHAVGPLEILVAQARLQPTDRLVAISMSGNVDRTVEAMTVAVERGLKTLAVVNGDGGRLAGLASETISLDIADVAPFLCGTSSYTATLASLLLIAQGAAGVADDLSDLVEAQVQTLAQGAVLSAVLSERHFSGIRFLSAGPELGSAAYGAAKIVELTQTHSWFAELEEFAHSQYWTMPTTDLVVFIATDPIVSSYAIESCRALTELGVVTLAIDTDDTPVITATWRFALPGVEPVFAPLVSAIPLQILAYEISQATGLNPNTRRHLKDDEQRFRASRMLTRRSLLGTGR
ncbi:SIS domain-containing protein [Agrobacterium pusense]